MTGSAGVDNLHGLGGDDTLNGASGKDEIEGGFGDDQIDGGDMADIMRGQEGFDTVSYASRSGVVNVTIGSTTINADGTGNDGVQGSGAGTDGGATTRDEVDSSVESVVGGSGNDLLTGTAIGQFVPAASTRDNKLIGNSGADTLTGLDGEDTLIGDKVDGTATTGLDTFVGGDGEDDIQARNNTADNDPSIDCGPGTDTATIDASPNDNDATVVARSCDNVRRTGSGPTAPTLTTVTPPSPNNSNNIVVAGSAAAGTTVRVYDNANCFGSASATGTPAQLAAGLAMTVLSDKTSSISADTELAGVRSATCSNVLTYTEDSTPPAPPTADSSVPAGPNASLAPKIIGTRRGSSRRSPSTPRTPAPALRL